MGRAYSQGYDISGFHQAVTADTEGQHCEICLQLLLGRTSKQVISQIHTNTLQHGAFFGRMTAFTTGDEPCRKQTVWLRLSMNIIGAILQITTFHLPQMIVGGITNGYGMGVIPSTCPVFMAETSPYHLRGSLSYLVRSATLLASVWPTLSTTKRHSAPARRPCSFFTTSLTAPVSLRYLGSQL